MQMQVKFFQVQTSYHLFEIQMFFSLQQKPSTQNTTDQSLLCTPGNKIQLDTGF